MEANQKRPLGITAYNEIYRRIMTLEYAPGQQLEEKMLMEALDIGRTPIREALLRLSADFMIESVPQKGFVVRQLTIQNIRAAFTALKILEAGVASLAIRHDSTDLVEKMCAANDALREAVKTRHVLDLVESNSQFHDYFAQCSFNEYLINSLHKVRCETNRLAYLSFGREVDPLRDITHHYGSVMEQHDKIIRYVKNRDEDRLKKTLEIHSQTFQKRIIMYMAG